MSFKFTKLLIGVIILVLTLLSSTLISQSALAAEVFTWYQNNPATPMFSTETGVCFLTSVEGKFEGSGEKVAVYIQGRQWFLGGTSKQSGVAGAATCVPWRQFLLRLINISGPYTWTQGKQGELVTTKLGGFNEGNAFCFLSGVAGKFEGAGERVEVDLDPYREWILKGISYQSGVSATAYCMDTPYNYTNLTSPFTWYQGAPTIILGDYASCFLTGMSGKFEGSRERITVSNYFGEWSLGGSSDQGGVSASARCYKR